MKLPSLVVASAAVASTWAKDFSVHQCDEHSNSELLHLETLRVSPENPVVGAPFTATVQGQLSGELSLATAPFVQFETRIEGVLLDKVMVPFCQDSHALRKDCIKLDADRKFSHTVTVDTHEKLPINIGVNVDAFVVNSEDFILGCLYGKTSFTGTSSLGEELPEGKIVTGDQLDSLFYLWQQEHDFKFDPKEHGSIPFRMQVFEDNLLHIVKHNQINNMYEKAMNQFGIWTEDEFKDKVNLGCFRGELKEQAAMTVGAPLAVDTFAGLKKESLFEADDNVQLPDTVDWVAKGAVTPVKNQGSCGSCWSFSTTGALEGAYFLKYGELKSFSEQELVSCDRVDQGCNGGLMDNAFDFIEKNGGLCLESDYPYSSGSGMASRCNKDCQVVSNSAPKSYQDIAHTENSMMAAVAQQPVAIAIEADQLAFQFYSRGVLTGRCGTTLDHGVLAVGYGVSKGTDYWKVKNSWGGTWGAKGYLLMQRGKNQKGGECGILLNGSIPKY